MKVTGITLMAIGVVCLLLSGFMAMQSVNVGANDNGDRVQTMLYVPLVMGLGTLIGGACILFFGGRGYIVLPKTRSS